MTASANKKPSLGNAGVATRLWGAVVLVIVALVALIGFSGYRSNAVQAEAQQMTEALDAKHRAAERWASLTATAVIRVQASVISTDPNVNAIFKDEVAATIAEINKVQKAIEAMDLTEGDRALMSQVAERRKVVLASSAKATELKTAGNTDAALAEVKNQFNPAVATYVAALREFVVLQETQKAQAEEVMGERRKSTVRIAGAVVAVIIIILLVGASMLVKSIKGPLDHALRMADRIAEGDLSVSANAKSQDEFGQLLSALDRMAANLRRLVGDVRHGVDSVSTASAEIATGNHDLSARTEQTASSLQQTASSMEELTATVAQSADTARQANQLASSAAEAAQRGGAVVSQVTENMNEITASSRKIGDIIGTIDGIAFQTNILALNAAVEAARAGEQGRGFAVVASEVRSLAQRSAEAAKEIKTLIGASMERVEMGAQLVEQSGAVMQDIVGSVRRVSDLIGEIAAAATEQRDGIHQVNQAVTQLDQMTQQNAALVEESAAAAQSLREQAGKLLGVVGQFNVGSHGATVSSAPASLPAPAAPRALPKPAGAAASSASSSSPSSSTSSAGNAGRAATPSATAPRATSTAKPAAKAGARKLGGSNAVARAATAGSAGKAAGSASTPAPRPAASPRPAPVPADDAGGDWETF